MANLLTKIVVITLVPLYTTYLTVFEVGLIVFLEMIELFVVTIIPIGCINAMWRYLPGEEVNIKNKIIIDDEADYASPNSKINKGDEDGLKERHEYRLLCVNVWGKYIDVVQRCAQKFKVFKGKMEETLKISTQNYRTANMEYRDTVAPAYFGSPHMPQFNEGFNEAYEAISEYHISDLKKREMQTEFRQKTQTRYISACR